VTVDVAVVGAGPSGAWAAYQLARRGARVALADPSHPREKPCGGGVTGRALSLIAGALDVAALPAVRVRAARFVDVASGASASVPLGSADRRDALVVVSRTALDGCLLAAAQGAGAAFVPARVTDVSRRNGQFELRLAGGRSIQARVVIGADGTNSLVRRRLSAPFARAQLSVATGAFAQGVTSEEIVIQMVADPPGYIWSFPRPDHLAIGICAAADAGVPIEALRARTLVWMQATGVGAGAPVQTYSWPIPTLAAGDFDRQTIAGAGWCLVGDAAGLVDPITREGIFFALQSAQFAAEAVAADAAPAAVDYAARVRDEIVNELARAARLKDRFFAPRFTAVMMEALAGSDPIRAVMADLIAGRQPYRGLRRRLLRTFEFGYAIKAARRSVST
jgi:geranylgeranyl reductase family protein